MAVVDANSTNAQPREVTAPWSADFFVSRRVDGVSSAELSQVTIRPLTAGRRKVRCDRVCRRIERQIADEEDVATLLGLGLGPLDFLSLDRLNGLRSCIGPRRLADRLSFAALTSRLLDVRILIAWARLRGPGERCFPGAFRACARKRDLGFR